MFGVTIVTFYSVILLPFAVVIAIHWHAHMATPTYEWGGGGTAQALHRGVWSAAALSIVSLNRFEQI